SCPRRRRVSSRGAGGNRGILVAKSGSAENSGSDGCQEARPHGQPRPQADARPLATTPHRPPARPKNVLPSPATKNGPPAPPVPPENIDRPPEHAEAEALAVFSEELKP